MHHAPEFKHPDEMDWEMGRFRNVTKFLFHPTPERPIYAGRFNMTSRRSVEAERVDL